MIPDELSINTIKKVYQQIKPYINTTPLIKANDFIDETLSSNIYLKYECFQKSGSFKARGAINNILSSSEKDLENGITAVSAGNHAIAASYAANIFNLKNKIFLYKSANKYRVQACKNYNANISFTVAEKAFDEVKDAEKQGYKFLHPFDGPHTLQGSATLGLEIIDQINDMDTKIDNVLISVGGGGLISGVGAVLKQFFPNINIIGIFGVEAIAGYTSAGRYEQLFFLPLLGLSTATVSIVGQNYGAKQNQRVFETYKKGIKIGVIVLSLLGLIIFLTADVAMNLFTDNANVKQYGSDYLKISALMFPAFPFFFIGNATFQGLKRAIIVMYMAIMRFVLMPLIVVSIIIYQIGENYNLIFFSLAAMHWIIGLSYYYYCNKKYKIILN